jgi:hypothetical protein
MYIPIWILLVVLVLMSETLGKLIATSVMGVGSLLFRSVPKHLSYVAAGILILLAVTPIVVAVIQ